MLMKIQHRAPIYDKILSNNDEFDLDVRESTYDHNKKLAFASLSTPCGAQMGDQKNSLFELCSVISYGSHLRYFQSNANAKICQQRGEKNEKRK